MPKKYIDSFINCVDFIIYSGGEIWLDPDIIRLAEADIGKGLKMTRKPNACCCKRAISGYMLLSGSGKHQYDSSLEIKKTTSSEMSTIIQKISAAHSLLLNYKQDPRNIIKMMVTALPL